MTFIRIATLIGVCAGVLALGATAMPALSQDTKVPMVEEMSDCPVTGDDSMMADEAMEGGATSEVSMAADSMSDDAMSSEDTMKQDCPPPDCNEMMAKDDAMADDAMADDAMADDAMAGPMEGCDPMATDDKTMESDG
ncbi:MAG: hypothetical protein WEB63_04090 [Cucumibacter sp.]